MYRSLVASSGPMLTRICSRDTGDGCSSSCTVEEAWYCNNTACSKSTCFTKCGDGLKGGVELLAGRCDDGNENEIDGCNSTCHVLCGFTCVSQWPDWPASIDVCNKACGDAILSIGEDCDDGNDVSGIPTPCSDLLLLLGSLPCRCLYVYLCIYACVCACGCVRASKRAVVHRTRVQHADMHAHRMWLVVCARMRKTQIQGVGFRMHFCKHITLTCCPYFCSPESSSTRI
jgi:cysteine-rich repeat protein